MIDKGGIVDIVGKGFEDGTIFLPQLLMSADAAKAAFDEITLCLFNIYKYSFSFSFNKKFSLLIKKHIY